MTAEPAARVLAVQFAITLLAGLAGLFYDRATGLSAAAGGVLCLGPNALAMAGLFTRRRARDPRAEGRRMLRARVVRWAAGLLGLGLLLALWPEVRPLPLFGAYALALAAPLAWHAFDGR